MNEQNTGFFAYPSDPSNIPETITLAVKKLNESGFCNIKKWQDCCTGGKFIIDVICRGIEDAKVFCADLTGFNQNVMFELGYAVARQKRILLFLDTSREDSGKNFEQLRILTTIGYIKYCNSDDIVTGFYRQKPWDDLENSIYKMSIMPNLSLSEHEVLLYLKARHNTEAEIRLTSCIEKYKLPLAINDPSESNVQSLAWYVNKIANSLGVIVHLCSPDRLGALLHNSRYSFVSGLSWGFQKPLLMLLSETGAVGPIDYQDILRRYQTAKECEEKANEWLRKISEGYEKKKQSKGEYLRSTALVADLKNLKVGEYIAENEKEELKEYFIETSSFSEALQGRHNLVVGRKGSGKTANLFAIQNTLLQDKRNLVCVVKPASYEIQSIIRLLKKCSERDEKGYMVESLWKFLLYSQIALEVVKELRSRPIGTVITDSPENELLQMMSKYSGVFHPEFAVRLENTIESLFNIKYGSIGEFRLAVSEKLHDGIIKELRSLLGKVLVGRKRVIVLIDNLDKAWDKNSELNSLCDFLLGLLLVSRDIHDDFARNNYWRKSVTMTLIVFLRTDIFSYLMQHAPEPDKISFSRLLWNDPEMLLRVIDERLMASRGKKEAPEEIWREMFVSHVDETPVRDYLIQQILPRPRDIVYFTSAAIATAVNRGHFRVEELDILEAEKHYSQFAFESIQVENGISLPELEKVLYEFAGQENAVMLESDVKSTINKAGIEQDKITHVIHHLCALSFLGMEIRPNEFAFSSEDEDTQKKETLAKKLAEEKGYRRYRINNPFHAFLEISRT